MSATYTNPLSHIIEQQWRHIIQCGRYNTHQIRQLNAIKSCRTPALGGELYRCNKCSQYHKRYFSCRNRNCPNCQKTQAHQWMDNRQSEVLPAPYYHCVFTVPDLLNEWFISYPRQMYKMLFDASWYTLNTFGWDPKYLGAQIGAIGILHTWGQNLSLHPHIHYVVPGGGIDYRGRWRHVKGDDKFLFPVKAMSVIFKAKLLKLWRKFLRTEGMQVPVFISNALYKKKWVVYSKPPFNGAKGALEYIGRYVFKTAISNHRILGSEKGMVTFRYKDYKQGGKQKTIALPAKEFIRRFSLHILPKRFIRIRHYGILSGRIKHIVFDLPVKSQKRTYIEYWIEKGFDILQCPHCKKGRLLYIDELPKRGPPKYASISYK